MTEEGSSCPVPFSTVRISQEGLSVLVPIIVLGVKPLEPIFQANPTDKGYLVVSKPTLFPTPPASSQKGQILLSTVPPVLTVTWPVVLFTKEKPKRT